MSRSIRTLKLVLATVGIIDPLHVCQLWESEGSAPRKRVSIAAIGITGCAEWNLSALVGIFQSWALSRRSQTLRVDSWFIPKRPTDYTLVQLSYRRWTMSRGCQTAVTSNHRSGRMWCRCQGGENLSSSSNQSTGAVRGFLKVRRRCHSRGLSFYTAVFDHSGSN